jgi:hypothetical protein
LDALGGLSIRDLLLLFLLSMLEKEEQEEKSSLAPALLLLGAISMQVNLSIQFGEDVGADTGRYARFRERPGTDGWNG